METALGCGYSINDESLLTDFYSPPTSIIDEEELFYPEEEEEEEISSTNSNAESPSQTDLSKLKRNFFEEKRIFLPIYRGSIKTFTIKTHVHWNNDNTSNNTTKFPRSFAKYHHGFSKDENSS